MNESTLPSEDTNQKPHGSLSTRRRYLNRIWSLLTLLAIVEISWLGGSIVKSRKKRDSSREKDTVITAGEAETFSRNSVTAIREGQFYLTRQQDGSFIALSRSCTHLGCSLPWDEKTAKFICPCHGSSFNIAGEVLSPPATRGLDSYPIRIENGIILVNIAKPEKRLSNTKPKSVKM
ncbi:MAG: Rieske (2Fe-2S) protein [Desulfobulbaceae bacterium]|nr:MAG: Rieske (2Fe-2S) protein [Desulfobulbaceae bacterium]